MVPHVMWSCGISVAGAHDSIELSANDLPLIASGKMQNIFRLRQRATERRRKSESEKNDPARRKLHATSHLNAVTTIKKRTATPTACGYASERDATYTHTIKWRNAKEKWTKRREKKKTLAIAIKIVLGIFHWMLAAAAVEYFRFLFDRFFFFRMSSFCTHIIPLGARTPLFSSKTIGFFFLFSKKANKLLKTERNKCALNCSVLAPYDAGWCRLQTHN